MSKQHSLINPIALRTAKTQWSFGHSEGSRVKRVLWNISVRDIESLLYLIFINQV